MHFQRTSETDNGEAIKLALTQQSVEKIVPDISIKEYRDARLKGLLLRVTPKGSKSYYCELGRGQRIFVGRADALVLSEAREAARSYLADYFKGDDPRVKRAANVPLPTLGEFILGPYTVWAQANQRRMQRIWIGWKLHSGVFWALNWTS